MVKRPGAFRIEEIDLSGPRPIGGVGTSTCGFLGTAERGPTSLTAIDGPDDYRRIFGGTVPGSYLCEAVGGFFGNGGERCYVARVAGSKALAASACIGRGGVPIPSLRSSHRVQGSREPDQVLRITALGPGTWGNRIQVQVKNGGVHGRAGSLDLVIDYRSRRRSPAPVKGAGRAEPRPPGSLDDIHELFRELSPDPSSRNFFARVVTRDSALVRMEGDPRPFVELKRPVPLGGGRDGRPPGLADYLGDPGAFPDERTGLAALSGEDEISLVTSPDMHRVPGLSEALARSSGERGDRFAILHTGPGTLPSTRYHPPFTSGYAALYYPWIIVKKERGRGGVPIPPCGHIAGAFARVDRTLGAHHSPAGESLAGVLGLAPTLAREEEDALDRLGVNTLRGFAGGRFTVLGSGTLDSGGIRSIATRRLLIYLEQSICRGIGWAVGEPDTTRAVEGLRASIGEFLHRAWAEGKLAGQKEREAFFVRRGRDKERAVRKTGPLVFKIGVAPEKPGEFVVFTITRESSRFTVKEE